ncbi:unnamed protein product, partial [marine sediment metagenome]
YDIIEVVSGSDGFFIITGDHVSEFPVDDTIIVSGSTGNDGTYTIVWNMTDAGKTYIFVLENVPSAVADGQLKSGLTPLLSKFMISHKLNLQF